MIVCLSISVIFWFLITLSKVYSGQIIFPLKYINLPDRQMVVSELPQQIEVGVKTSGFEILSHQFKKKEDSLIFDTEKKLQGARQYNKNVIIVLSKALAEDITEKLGTDYSISNVYPDSVVFSFVNRSRKKVPVVLDSKLTFEKQFDTTDHPIIIPDSVTISGPDTIIKRIHYVETTPLVHANLKSSLTTSLKLKKDSFVTVAPEQVTVKVPIEKFTEGTLEIPINVINVKTGYSLKTFPDKVIVHYQVPLSRYNNISPAMFNAVANAASLPNSDIQQLKVTIVSPEIIRSPVAIPEKVDYILRKKY